MTLFRKKYTQQELDSIISRFHKYPYGTIMNLKSKRGNKKLIQKLHQLTDNRTFKKRNKDDESSFDYTELRQSFIQ